MKLVEEMRRALRDVRDPRARPPTRDRVRRHSLATSAGGITSTSIATMCLGPFTRFEFPTIGRVYDAGGRQLAREHREITRTKTVHRRSRRDPGRRGQAHEFRDAIFVSSTYGPDLRGLAMEAVHRLAGK